MSLVVNGYNTTAQDTTHVSNIRNKE